MTTSLKILMTTDVSNNKWDYTNALCESILSLQKAQILLVSTGRSYEPKQVDYAECINSDISVKWENNFHKFKSNNEDFGEFIDEIAKDFQPNIMHLNHYCNNIQSSATKVLTTHGDALNNIKWTSFNMHFHPYKQYIQSCLDSSDRIVATTKVLAKNLLGSYELNKQINLIYNGVHCEPYIGEKSGMVLLTSSKSLLKKHNLDMVLRILQRLPDDMKIYVIGTKPAWLRLPEKLEFLGHLSNDELKKYYEKASIYLALSSWDIFNMNTFYAACSGCALLACDSPIFREIWGDSAHFFDMNSPDNFMRNLNNLLENKLLFEKVTQSCKNKALATYTLKRMGFEYLNLYKKEPSGGKNISKKSEIKKDIQQDIFIQ